MKIPKLLSPASAAPAGSAGSARSSSERGRYGLDSLLDALAVAYIRAPRWGWLAPALIVLVAGILRFYNLAHPNAIVFDETYYAKDAYSYVHYGYELSWSKDANASFAAGHPSGLLTDSPEYVVHPPLGKWMIAAGMAIFGDNNPFGWRVSAAVIGTLSVALIAYVGWLLFRSMTVATIAALLAAVDGLMLVESRLALLDIFQMFWILATFACLVLDRIQARRVLARHIAEAARQNGGVLPPMPWGPSMGLRLWRFAAGVCAGAAVGVKWNSLFFIAAMGLLTVFWDINARRIVGLNKWGLTALVRDGIPAFFQMIGVGLLVYLSTWAGWFQSSNAYFRRWAVENPGKGVMWLPEDLRSLWEYHVSAFKFHSGLSSPHTYSSQAWQWLVLGRPTSYYYESPKLGSSGCTVKSCSEAILNIGNPAIWWAFIPAIIVALLVLVLKRDWRFGALLVVFGAGYFPWFMYPTRTMFYFYALSFEPFLILLLAGVLGLALSGARGSVLRARLGVTLVAIYLVGVLMLSAYFMPLWTAQVIPYEQWYSHMWFKSWI